MKRKGVRVKSLSPNCTVRVFSARDCTMQYSTTLNELHRTSKKCATSKLRRLCSTYKVTAKKKKNGNMSLFGSRASSSINRTETQKLPVLLPCSTTKCLRIA